MTAECFCFRCRQDLSDQTLLLRMQGDSIKMLLEEVRLAGDWGVVGVGLTREMKTMYG